LALSGVQAWLAGWLVRSQYDASASPAGWTVDPSAGWHQTIGGGMALLLTCGSMLRCSFGAAPAPLQVLPLNRVVAGDLAAANIMDNVPIVNIPPFGTCSSLANPVVATATGAAFGVLTPMPCVPATSAPWVPGTPTVMIGGMPAVDTGCMLMCMWAGVIQVSAAGQFTVVTP
jgi:hypothetical protein